ncbi:MAG TPA: acyl-CoA dehydrogenase family protein [Pseudolysinimonas sp.]|nr:acyl-CoA dehydrogenase family protein [Pseudolysinimonas sp.]
MDFALDDDAVELGVGLKELLGDLLVPGGLRAAIEDRDARLRLRTALVENGASTVLVPDSLGGLGLGWAAAVACAEELGRAGVPGGVLDAFLIAPAVLGLGTGFESELAEIAAGKLHVVVADERGVVVDGPEADGVLVVEGDEIALYDAGQVEFAVVPTLDEGFPVFRVSQRGSARRRSGFAVGDVATARRFGALATSAALVGAGRHILTMTSQYVATREQFGRPVGSFQGVQHPLVDVSLGLEFAAPVVRAAAWSVDVNLPEQVERVAHAKSAAATAATRAWRTGLQSHGAIGYTYEYDLQIWLKRCLSLGAHHGHPATQRALLRDVARARLAGAALAPRG